MGEKTVILLSILLLLVLSCSSLSYAQSATPVEVVNIFNRCYGEPCMDDAAEITSAHFRDGRPESVWVGETWMEMKGIKYKTLESSVIDSRVKDDRAVVVWQVKINTVVREAYFLVRENGGWVVDRLMVTDGNVDLERVPL